MYATAPLKAIVGVGTVTDGVEFNDLEGLWYFVITWDAKASKKLAKNPVQGILDRLTQQPRRASDVELDRLARAMGGKLPQADSRVAEIVRRRRDVIQRQGQREFRDRLMVAYGGACAFTGTDVAEVLQAAHIRQYAKAPDNSTSNGLLLRADIHNLFDLGRLWVTSGGKIGVAPDLDGTVYGRLKGKTPRRPKKMGDRPEPRHLAEHRSRVAGRG